jgi:hypothetical protein
MTSNKQTTDDSARVEMETVERDGRRGRGPPGDRGGPENGERTDMERIIELLEEIKVQI